MTARLKAATFKKLFITGLPSGAAQPEYEDDYRHEDYRPDGDDLRGVCDRGRKGFGRGVSHDSVDMPVLPYRGAHETHEAHEPGERYRNEEECVLAPARHAPPPEFSSLGAPEHESFYYKACHYDKQGCRDLRHR